MIFTITKRRLVNLNYNKRILTKLFETSKQRALNRNEVKDKHVLKVYALPNWKIFSDLMLKNKLIEFSKKFNWSSSADNLIDIYRNL